ncbi:hypothetical protein AVEN_162925-1 [Araneus ventricosus]|uniref:Reverse transcriptase domain-containing protein n=1 Tax=Araneus ventricosus TaxID=182803 RepID=A0A4Y2C063_ARAVE|nr:hypothetical protein AVEN_162925-1 [Araneus ventricosus]
MIVFIIVEKLDKSTRYWWEKELNNSEDFGTLKQLLSFLQSQARTLQNSKIKEVKKNHNFHNKVTSMVSTSNTKSTKFKCVKCQREEFHGLYKCPEFINLSVHDRCVFVKRNNLCFNCLKFHAVRNCTSTFRCQKCSKKHSTLLHFENEKQNRIERSEIGDGINSQSITASSSLNPNAANFESSYERNVFSGAAVSGGEVRQTKTAILSTANIFVRDCFGNLKSARALLDVGSMCSFITTEFADLLQIKKEKISIAVSGLNSAKINVSSRVCTVVSNKSDFEMRLEFLCVPKISSMIPIDSLQIPKEHLPLNIKLADPYFYRPGKIDVLLGAELESIGIKDDPSCNEVDQSLEIFEKTVCYKDNRYEVELPWKRDWHELNDNYSVAKKRLDSLVRRFKKNPDLNLQYRETLHDYEKNGIIEKVPNPENPINKPVFYMPHQPVFRDESSTTKMRIVFDASSSHSFQHLSLNDCLWPGPNLNSNIFDILINFRLNKFAFISDIEKAFLQLTLAEKDRDAVRFLCTENDTLQVYRFNRVLFGVRSSPFLLSASIKTHLKKFHDEFPTTTECLNRCFYVDDFISGADSLQDALEISTQAVSIMDQASMVLRKWTTNSDELRQLWIREGLENQLQDNPISPRANSTKVLGMLWNTVEDYLIVGTQSLVDSLSNNENTKRHLLRAIGKIFDPLGLLSPFIIRVKCILQVLWMKEISWDEELPPDIQKAWCQWVSEVPRLSELQVPRYVPLTS